MPGEVAQAMSRTGGIAAFWRRMKQRLRVRSELAALGSEAGAVARDLCVDAGELSRLAGYPAGSTDLLHVRMESLGLTEVAHGNPAVMRDLERTCSSCCLKARCKRELSDERTAPAVAPIVRTNPRSRRCGLRTESREETETATLRCMS
jgi:hypothetical protein